MKSIALVGKPNTGKSLLFNRLTGLNQKVTNFPGITVEVRRGQKGDFKYYDFPGVYSFATLSQEERVAVEKLQEYIQDKKVDQLLCTLDATSIAASLQFGLEVRDKAQQANLPIVFALNMIDEVADPSLLDIKGLESELGCSVVPISARTGQGLNLLLDTLKKPNHVKAPASVSPYQESMELSQKFGLSTLKAKTRLNLDKLFLSPILGVLSFILIMTVLFQSVFTFAVPFMDMIESAIVSLADLTVQSLPDGILKDFIVDAFWGGIGSFLVFVPQIFFLTFIIGILEDSGYLARAAMLCHRPLRYFGLSGKSFIPMLTGHACAIPAVYATRMIDSPKRRLITMLILPLMGCSARLPVYAFLIAAVIPSTTYLGGLVGLQGVALFSMYLLGVVLSLAVSWVLSRFVYRKQEDIPFILELPRYRMPHWKPLVLRSFESVWQFVSRAGLMIFIVTAVVWVLGYFPTQELESSYLGLLGHLIEPVLTPLQLDWKYGVAILTSFLAREVFVGTLGTLFEIENADEDFTGLVENVQSSGLSFAAGMGLLVFYAIALQCASTFAVLKSELGKYKTPIYLFIGYSLLAYVGAWLTVFVLS